MEGICVGEKRLNIDRAAFKMTASAEGDTVIDGWTTIVSLVEAAYAPLRAEVNGLLQGKLEQVNHPALLCSKGDIRRDSTGFPVVTFELAGTVELGLDVLSLFLENEPGEFCMALRKSREDNKWNMIGLLAQQNYNVGYNPEGKQLTIQRIDCEILETSV